MKRETLFLRIAIFLIGLPILVLCIFLLYWLVKHPASTDYAYMLYPIVFGMFCSAIPFFAALYQSLKLLGYIDINIAFSELSVSVLNIIKYCAITISILYAVIMPLVYLLADKEDAPGLIIIGMVPVFTSMIIAVFAAMLQKLLKNAIEIKSENDLTV